MYVPLREDTLKGKDNNPRWPDAILGIGEKGRSDTKGEPKAIYIVELKKINPDDKAKDIQKIKTTEEKFKSFYKLKELVTRPVNVFEEIVLEEGEEKYEEK